MRHPLFIGAGCDYRLAPVRAKSRSAGDVIWRWAVLAVLALWWGIPLWAAIAVSLLIALAWSYAATLRKGLATERDALKAVGVATGRLQDASAWQRDSAGLMLWELAQQLEDATEFGVCLEAARRIAAVEPCPQCLQEHPERVKIAVWCPEHETPETRAAQTRRIAAWGADKEATDNRRRAIQMAFRGEESAR